MANSGVNTSLDEIDLANLKVQ